MSGLLSGEASKVFYFVVLVFVVGLVASFARRK